MENTYFNPNHQIVKFNTRVLNYSKENLPIGEKLAFLKIFDSNMDEYFETRAVNSENSKEIHNTINKALATKSSIFKNAILKQLQIRLLNSNNISKPKDIKIVKNYFNGLKLSLNKFDVKSIVNKQLYLYVETEAARFSIKIPDTEEFMIQLSNNKDWITLPEIIKYNLNSLVKKVKGVVIFRVTRDNSVVLEDDNIIENITHLKKIRKYKGAPLRLEVGGKFSTRTLNNLKSLIDKDIPTFITKEGSPEILAKLNIAKLNLPKINSDKLFFKRHIPSVPTVFRSTKVCNILDEQNEMLLHHPFETFVPVINMVAEAADDPNVVSIKQTLYRVGKSSPVVAALIKAAKNGKDVTAVIELRASFDEENNLEVAKELEEAGCLVVFASSSHKVHAKMILITKKDADGKYTHIAHLGTGNYHYKNVKIYTDYSLFTKDQIFCNDVAKLFNYIMNPTISIKTEKLLFAPENLYSAMEKNINLEIESAKKGDPAFIMLKINSITEKGLIDKLYEAAAAGVKVDIISRTSCSIVPRKNIRVRSIVGRFLEHSRVFYFSTGDKLYCSSADWMERNLFNRIEACFPIENESIKNRIVTETFTNYLKDETASELTSTGSWIVKNKKKKKFFSAQSFLENRFK